VKTADFDYDLPAELIAQQPLEDRAASRMMVVDRASGEIHHDHFRNLGRFLLPGDLLVLNDTKVLPARIWSKQPVVELLLVENLGGNRWAVLVKPGRRAKHDSVLEFEEGLCATVEGDADFGGRILHFTGDVESYAEKFGAAPLPPYIRRPQPQVSDLSRYQTVYAQRRGAIAAPTAGLHFTSEILSELNQQGVRHAFITLHVGIGTFQPVKAENVDDHKMHAEKFFIPAETRETIRRANRVVAVGTTVVRALESDCRSAIVAGRAPKSAATMETTNLFIRPPFKFQAVDVLLTNFHLPRSTLLMLVSAFAGRELIMRAYAEAVRERYRFFSYGDCMLIL
jgi:S-adenosylmethionine:tRNA ribosyltransferase-isomerase